MLGAVFGIVILLFIFAVILIAAYYVTKFVGIKTYGNLNNRNIKIIEVIALNKDSYLYIIKVGNAYKVISCSSNNINYLFDVNEEELILNDFAKKSENNFSKYFLNLIKKDKNLVSTEDINEDDINEDDIDFKSKLDIINNKRKDIH